MVMVKDEQRKQIHDSDKVLEQGSIIKLLINCLHGLSWNKKQYSSKSSSNNYWNKNMDSMEELENKRICDT